jgi:hypothetical protein
MTEWSDAGDALAAAVTALDDALINLAVARHNRGSANQGVEFGVQVRHFLRSAPGGGAAIAEHAHALANSPGYAARVVAAMNA